MTDKIDLYCICNPLIDIGILDVPDNILNKLGLVKNSMNLVDDHRQVEILTMLNDYQVHTEVGGSGVNTAVLFSQLGGKSAFNGKISNDENGRRFLESLEKSRVQSCMSVANDGYTGSTIILVNKDGARTMNTNLGISRSFCPDDLFLEDLAKSKTAYFTGYCWDTDNQQKAVVKALEHATQNNVKVALCLADPFCVERHFEAFRELILEYVDIGIMNLSEGQILSQKNDIEDIIKYLSERMDHFVITNSKHGSVIYYDKQQIQIPPYHGEAIDSTGAGDVYAGAYLYGLSAGLGVEKSGHLASYFAGLIIGRPGPRFTENIKELADGFLAEKITL